MLIDRIRSLFDAGRRDRRIAPRRKTLLAAEVLPVASFASVKILNVSKSGCAGETAAPLQANQPLIFSLGGNRFHQGTVRWVRGQKFGMELDDALGILGYSDAVDPALLGSRRARPRRYPVDLDGQIVVGSPFFRATVRDVSQSGLRIEVGAPLEIGQQVVIRLSDRPLILATVRWRAHRMLGFETAERMQTLRLAYAGE